MLLVLLCATAAPVSGSVTSPKVAGLRGLALGFALAFSVPLAVAQNIGTYDGVCENNDYDIHIIDDYGDGWSADAS